MDSIERKKRYNDRHRAKNVEKLREQDRERKRLMRLKQTNNPEAHDEQKRKDKDRKILKNATKSSTSSATSTNSTPRPAYKHNSTRADQ